MAGLVPAIHEKRRKLCRFPWMPGTRPGMTSAVRLHHLNVPARLDFMECAAETPQLHAKRPCD